MAGPPKHMAVHTPHVKVGVINNLKKFVGLDTHKYHQAPNQGIVHDGTKGGPGGGLVFKKSLHVGGIKGSGVIGQTAGRHHTGVGSQVNAEKIGSHSSIFKPSQIGAQKSVGSFHGAKGAQLSGVAIHPPHQKPQLNPCNILSTLSKVASTFAFICAKSHTIFGASLYSVDDDALKSASAFFAYSVCAARLSGSVRVSI